MSKWNVPSDYETLALEHECLLNALATITHKAKRHGLVGNALAHRGADTQGLSVCEIIDTCIGYGLDPQELNNYAVTELSAEVTR